jgi:hypothetical protein
MRVDTVCILSKLSFNRYQIFSQESKLSMALAKTKLERVCELLSISFPKKSQMLPSGYKEETLLIYADLCENGELTVVSKKLIGA